MSRKDQLRSSCPADTMHCTTWLSADARCAPCANIRALWAAFCTWSLAMAALSCAPHASHRRISGSLASHLCACPALHSPPDAQIIKVGIAEAGTLRGLVDKIFDKALTDPEAQRTLAELCTVMPAHVSR